MKIRFRDFITVYTTTKDKNFFILRNRWWSLPQIALTIIDKATDV